MVRRLLFVATLGLTLLTGAGFAAAQPEDPDQGVPEPGLVDAVSTCHNGTAAIKVWIDDSRDGPLPVRLDRLRPDTATQTGQTELDDESGMHVVTFEPVAIGDYNVHVERKGAPADDLPVVVKPCGDLKPSDDPLRVEVECQAGWGIATFVVANPKTKEVVTYTLTVDGPAQHIVDVSEGMFLRVTQNIYDDGTHRAQLLIGDEVIVTKTFTVTCASGNAPKLNTNAACNPNVVTIGVLNPNRKPVTYTVKIKDQERTVTAAGGKRGEASFPDLPRGEHPVLVTGNDETEAASVVKVACGTEPTTTTPPTTTTTPAPQGRPGGDLANTGAAVGGLLGIGALILGLGGALVIIGRRRRAH